MSSDHVAQPGTSRALVLRVSIFASLGVFLFVRLVLLLPSPSPLPAPVPHLEPH